MPCSARARAHTHSQRLRPAAALCKHAPVSKPSVWSTMAPLPPQVAAALQQIKLTDSDGTLLQDPRSTELPWRQQLPTLVPKLAATQDSLQPDASHIGGESGRVTGWIGRAGIMPPLCAGGLGAVLGTAVGWHLTGRYPLRLRGRWASAALLAVGLCRFDSCLQLLNDRRRPA